MDNHQAPAAPASDQQPRREGRWRTVLKRTVSEAREDGITDLAAAMTYYAVLALFPALLVLVSLVGLVGNPERTTEALLRVVANVMPESATEIMAGAIERLAASETAGALFSLGLLGAVWSASGYIAAFTRAMNTMYEVEESRPFWKLRPLQIGLTLATLVGAAIIGAGLLLSGPFARTIGEVVGLSEATVTAWNYGKWPAMVLIVALGLAILYWVTPNVEQPRFRWLTIGSILAIVLSVLASVGFGFYTANFGSYNATYGSLGAVIVFLVWLWIVNLAILLGAELDAEYIRARRLARGEQPSERGTVAHAGR